MQTQRKETMIMSENLNVSLKGPKVNYVIIEIKRIKLDENGHVYEVVEEHKVPDFLANILNGTGNVFIDNE